MGAGMGDGLFVPIRSILWSLLATALPEPPTFVDKELEKALEFS